MNPVKNQNNKAGLALAAAMVALTLYWPLPIPGRTAIWPNCN